MDLVKFDKSKCQVLHLGWRIAVQQGNSLCSNWMEESSCVEKVDNHLNSGQQCALVANRANFIVICLSKKANSRPREWIPPLWSALETISGVLCPSLGFTVKDRYQEWSKSGRRPPRWSSWWKTWCIGRVWENRVCSALRREREGRNTIVVFNYQTRSL